MKQARLWWLAVCVLLWAVDVQGRTLAEIRRSDTLRVCVAGSSAAYYRINGEDFARTLGVRAQVTVLSSWDQQFLNAQGVNEADTSEEPALLASGQCDLLPNDLHMLAWRVKRMALVPYGMTRNVVVARPELRNVLVQESDLAGRRAAVQAGTAYDTWLSERNATAWARRPVVVQHAPTAQSMALVAQRQADFTVIAAESAFKWVRDDLEHLDLLFAVGEASQVGWAIGRNATDLREALERYFAQSRRVGSRLDLSWRRYYGVSLMEYRLFSASFDTRPQFGLLWSTWGIPVVSAIAGVLCAMLFWARRLRREVALHRVDAQALRRSQERMARETAQRQAVSELLLALQQVDSLQAFGQAVLREMARQFPMGQALFATVHAAQEVRAHAHYAGAGATPVETLAALPSTMGLVQRCLATAEPVIVERPGPDYLRIHSGLGSAAPAAILLLPIKRAGHVVALIEMAVSRALTAEQRALLDAFEPVVAASLGRFHQDAPTEHAT